MQRYLTEDSDIEYYVNIAVFLNFLCRSNYPYPPQPQAVSFKVITPFHYPNPHPRRYLDDICIFWTGVDELWVGWLAGRLDEALKRPVRLRVGELGV
jgi:hypothetical protein